MSPRILATLAVAAVIVLSSVLVTTAAPRGPAPPSAAAPASWTWAPSTVPTGGAALPPPQPAAALNLAVGQGPDALAIDAPNGTAFVANEYSNNVSEISLASGTHLADVPVGSEPYPGALAVDSANGTAYVANYGSNNVSAISLSLGGVSATIAVGSSPDAILFNPANKDVYVANAGSGNVTVISTTTNRVALNIPVGPDPVALAFNSLTHDVLVAVAGSNNLSIISAASNRVVATITVGNNPDAIAFDAALDEIFVAAAGSGNVSAVGGVNHTFLYTVGVGSDPSALVADPARAEVFVANRFSDNMSVISTKTNSVVATIPLGSQPGTNGAIAFDAAAGAIVVPNGGSSNVSAVVAATNTTGGAVSALSLPSAIAINPNTSAVWVADQGAANLTIFKLAPVTFQAVGLPAGSNWSVAAGSPSFSKWNVTARTLGRVSFLEINGTMPFAVTAPAGYGVAHVNGPHFPAYNSANLTGLPTTLTLVFGPIETLRFNESGLPTGASWSVAIRSAYPHGGAPGQNGTSTGPSINFTVVKGPWKYQVTSRPSTYRPAPALGAVRVNSAPLTKTLRFVPVTERVLFRELGLAPGTIWGVNISGPMTLHLVGSMPTLSANLVNGSYTFVVWNFTALHPHTGGTPHDAGSLVVTAPAAPQVKTVTYSSSV